MDAQLLIERFGLVPHPEGGWYREMHRSSQAVTRSDGQQRSGLTAILFLLVGGAVSRWHRVSRADESWHFVAGDPLELLVIPAGGGMTQRHCLGEISASLLQAVPLAVAPADSWQAARSLGLWSLVSCCVGPGFDFADFTLLRDLPSEEYPPGVLLDFL